MQGRREGRALLVGRSQRSSDPHLDVHHQAPSTEWLRPALCCARCVLHLPAKKSNHLPSFPRTARCALMAFAYPTSRSLGAHPWVLHHPLQNLPAGGTGPQRALQRPGAGGAGGGGGVAALAGALGRAPAAAGAVVVGGVPPGAAPAAAVLVKVTDNTTLGGLFSGSWQKPWGPQATGLW